MPISINVDILRDQASEILNRLADPDLIRSTNKVAGRDVANLLRRHFSKLDNSRANKLGGRRTHFYAQLARSVRQDISGDTVRVSAINVGIAQRYFGGTILPKNSRWLTIPVSPAAYGKRAREFDSLRYQKTKNGAALIDNESNKIFYILVKSVTQKADRSVLPTEEKIRETALVRAVKYLDRISEQRSDS